MEQWETRRVMGMSEAVLPRKRQRDRLGTGIGSLVPVVREAISKRREIKLVPRPQG